jgi:uncharacterized protein involved in tolerance to divalent cations
MADPDASPLFDAVEAGILATHRYGILEVVRIPIVQGLDRHLGWVAESTN